MDIQYGDSEITIRLKDDQLPGKQGKLPTIDFLKLNSQHDNYLSRIWMKKAKNKVISVLPSLSGGLKRKASRRKRPDPHHGEMSYVIEEEIVQARPKTGSKRGRKSNAEKQRQAQLMQQHMQHDGREMSGGDSSPKKKFMR